MRSGFLAFAFLFSVPVYGDFQYQSTVQMTGGALMQMTRFVPGAGKAREPQVTTVAVKGNRLVRKGSIQTEIIDLEKRTITNVHPDKRTYSVMTFDQMKQMLNDMNAKVQEQKQQQPAAPDMSIDANIEKTGQTRTIQGYDTKEAVLTMSMSMTDPRTGQSGAMNMKMDMWVAPDVPGYPEVRDFYRRMAKELDWSPGGFAMLNRPDIARAVAKMMSQGGMIDGTPIEEILKIQPVAAANGTPAATPASQPQQNTATPSASTAIAGALSGRLGGLGGLGRKKSQSATGTTQDQAAAPGDASLIEMTISNTNFSSQPVDPSLFEIPAGFSEVPAYTGQNQGGR
jgi:hypothetical protein